MLIRFSPVADYPGEAMRLLQEGGFQFGEGGIVPIATKDAQPKYPQDKTIPTNLNAKSAKSQTFGQGGIAAITIKCPSTLPYLQKGTTGFRLKLKVNSMLKFKIVVQAPRRLPTPAKSPHSLDGALRPLFAQTAQQ